MTGIPWGVLAVYAAVGVWAVITVMDVRNGAYKRTIWFGIGLALVLNLRYIIEGPAAGIAFFVGIYDVFDNLGLAAGASAPALATCAGNACSVWGDVYTNHPSWGVAFYDRFANGPQLRTSLLYGHIIFNSIVFVLMHYQLARPGTGENQGRHRLLGRISFACITIGTICAVWLASEHGSVSEYGGVLSQYGFYFMSLCVYTPAVLAVISIRNGDPAMHRIWMIRFVGAMWGAFWLFRLMLLITGPLLRNWDTASILFNIWLSAPLGIILAEVLRRKWEQRSLLQADVAEPNVAVAAK